MAIGKRFEKKGSYDPDLTGGQECMEEIKGFHKSLIILSVCYVIAGVILLFWPDMSIDIFCKGLGIGMLVVGITHIIIYFTKDHMRSIMQMDLVIGVVCAAFGAFLLLHPDFVEMAMPFAVGILLMIGAIIKLQNSIDMKHLKFVHWKAVLALAVLMLLMGAVLIYNPFTGRILLIYIGVALIMDGVINVVCMLCISHRLKKLVRNPELRKEMISDADDVVDMPVPAEKGKQELEIRK